MTRFPHPIPSGTAVPAWAYQFIVSTSRPSHWTIGQTMRSRWPSGVRPRRDSLTSRVSEPIRPPIIAHLEYSGSPDSTAAAGPSPTNSKPGHTDPSNTPTFPSATASTSSSSSGSSNHLGAIIGGIIGGVLGLVMLLTLGFWLYYRRVDRSEDHLRSSNGGNAGVGSSANGHPYGRDPGLLSGTSPNMSYAGPLVA